MDTHMLNAPLEKGLADTRRATPSASRAVNLREDKEPNGNTI
jgi:hypothetical protein